ncbi:unnamed protein product, partial [Chrysoparadoxa australica]
MDLSGPMPASFGGRKYILSITDDWTRMRWSQFITSKSETTQAVREWYAKTTVPMDLRLARIRTDNGGEFTAPEFMAFCTEHGIMQEFTSRATPEMNGVAERSIAIIRDKAMTMLEDARMMVNGHIERLWAEAMSYATWVTNLTSSTAVIGELSPYEAFFGLIPPVTLLKPFGTLCIAHIPKAQRRKTGAREAFSEDELLDDDENDDTDGNYHKLRRLELESLNDFESDHIAEQDTDEDSDDVELMRGIDQIDMDVETTQEPGTQDQPAMHSLKQSSLLREIASYNQGRGDIPDATTSRAARTAMRTQRSMEQTSPQTVASETAAGNGSETEMVEDTALMAPITDKLPRTLNDVMKLANKDEWLEAVNVEMQAMHSHGVVEEVPIPTDVKLIGTKFLFSVKHDTEGRETKKKVRLVAQGFNQEPGQDYNMRFSPVANSVVVRMVIALAARDDLVIRQFDIKTAFLHAPLSEEGEDAIYLKPPIGYQREGYCWKAVRAIYGLIQSPAKFQQLVA